MRKQTIKQFAWIHWQRTKKRNRTNREIIAMVIDPVTAFYLIPFIVIGGLVLRDVLIEYQALLQQVSEMIFTHDMVFLGIMVGQNGLFKKAPILNYSSSERLMEYVSHKRRDLFMLLWFKQLLSYFIIDSGIAVFLLIVFPVYRESIMSFIIVVFITQVGLIIPRVYLASMTGWRGFIERLVIQIGVLAIIALLVVSTGEQRLTILTFLLVTLATAHIVGVIYIEHVSDLDYIITVSDHKSYRTLLSKLFFSKTAVKDVPIKRQEWYEKKRYRQKLSDKTMWKLYARLISQHVSEQNGTILQMVMQLLFIVVLLSLQSPMFLRVGMVIFVLLFIRMNNVIFQSIFGRPLLKSLPVRQGPWSRYYGVYSIFSLMLMVLVLIGYSHLLYGLAFTPFESFTFLLIAVILNRKWLNRVIKKLTIHRPKETIIYNLSLVYMVGYGLAFETYEPFVYGLASVITGLITVELISKRFRSEKT